MATFGEKVIDFHQQLDFKGQLPKGYRVLNPFTDNPETLEIMKRFYHKFYNDNQSRKFIIAINPGRLGAGTTGVPFTDTKRLESECKITMESAHTHEVSAVFIYRMIKEFGGVKSFYQQFYINSVFPLAIVRKNNKGSWVNANYYDELPLYNKVKDYMIAALKHNINLGLNTEKVFILGKKNAQFIKKLNREEQLFSQMTVLEHPRYIQQYKSKDIQFYLDKYMLALKGKGRNYSVPV